MGNGIAHVFAQYGFQVTLNDVSTALTERGLNTIKSNLDRQIKKGALAEEEKQLILSRLKQSTSLELSAKNADLIVEAATENKEIKKQIFRAIDDSAPARAVLASNTSSIS